MRVYRKEEIRSFMVKIIGYKTDTGIYYTSLKSSRLTAALFTAHAGQGCSDERLGILDFILSQHVSGEPIIFPLLCHHGMKLKVGIVTSSRVGRDGHSIPSGLSETKWKIPAKLKWCSSMFPQCAFNYDVDISQHLATSVRSHKPLALSECAQMSSFI